MEAGVTLADHVQVGKLSSGDPLETRRELYLRNVSSKDLAKKVAAMEEPEEDALPATRSEGDTISFHRCATAALSRSTVESWVLLRLSVHVCAG